MDEFKLQHNAKAGGSKVIDYKSWKIQFRMCNGMSIKFFKQVDGVWYKAKERNYNFANINGQAIDLATNYVDNYEQNLIDGLNKQLLNKSEKQWAKA